MSESIDWTRIKNDVNGNPRYVCHYTNLSTEEDRRIAEREATLSNGGFISIMYRLAVKRANKIGGRKYHTRAYGGGIVFQSYSIRDTEQSIREIVAKG